MSGKGKFKKQLSLMDLTFIGLGAIFGSGWNIDLAGFAAAQRDAFFTADAGF